jgi:glycosyltransferase involved in cell wall biosynthesis
MTGSPQDSTRPEISIVVPVFNESGSIEELATTALAACRGAGRTLEILFVDDGSNDETWKRILEIRDADPAVKGIRFRRNYGKSAAVSAGFQMATGKYVVTMDGDLQDDPNEVPQMIETLEGGYDLVSGWKKKRRDPLSKRLPSRFFNFVTRIVSGIPLHDFNCGLKAYRAEVVKDVHVYGELHRYIPLLAKWEGYERIGEQIVQHHPRKHGKTKFGLERFVRGFLDLISVIFLTRYTVRPMHFFGTLGTLAFLGGFGISLYLTIQKFMGHPIGNRPLLFLGLLLIIFGIQLLTTGLLGEMINRTQIGREDRFRVEEAVGLADDQDERSSIKTAHRRFDG